MDEFNNPIIKPKFEQESYKNYKLIGFWKQFEKHAFPDRCNSNLPMPECGMLSVYKGFIEKYKKVINDKNITETEQYNEISICRICKKTNGSKEYYIKDGDSGFVIPEGYLHYMEEHDVAPPIDLFGFINRKYQRSIK